MAILPIRTFGDPVLRQRAAEIERVDGSHARLGADMIETMRDAPGVGLAGPQVAILQRIFVWEVEEEHGIFVNPVVVSRSSRTFTDEEGCLSLPGLMYPVERAFAVTVEALDEHCEPVHVEAEDHLARIFQHEIDHLDGVLFIDRLPDDLRRDALRTLRDQSLGLATTTTPPGERF